MARKSSRKAPGKKSTRRSRKVKRKIAATPRGWKENLPSDGLVVLIGTRDMSPADAETIAKKIARTKLDGKWVVKPMGKDCCEFSFRRPPGEKNPTAAEAWELSYQLKDDRDVADCEPALFIPVNGPVEMLPEKQQKQAREFLVSASSSSSPDTDDNLTCSDDKQWSIDLCRIPQAWNLPLPPGGKSQGEGISIGHPDTGYTRHSEINDTARLLTESGFDFEDDDDDPEDDLSGFSGGHGTSTASVIMSGIADQVTGAAPKAKLVPLRVTSSVVLTSFSRLSQAIRFAADNGHHVVSMSLGSGPPIFNTLRRAVEHAIRRGVILLAAAGNFVPFVTYPAALDEVIAVAACNCKEGGWRFSSSGSAVDITAPGESVWRAIADGGVGRSNGTSYAVATTAGVAAMWLAYHGRQNLIEKYGLANVPTVFKELLVTQGFRRPPGWDTSEFGPGILDARKLLSAPLPETAAAGGLSSLQTVAVPPTLNQFDRMMTRFPGKSPAKLRTGLCRMLDVKAQNLETAMREVGPEIDYHLATNPRFRAQLLATPPGKGAAAKTKAMRSALRTTLKRCGSKRLLSLLKG